MGDYRTLRFEDNGNLAIYNKSGTTPLWSTNTLVSDMRLKDRIQVIDTFPNLTGYTFRYEWQPEGHKKTCGCMLQHVEEQAPEATENGQVFLEKLVPFLIEKIKRLGRRIDTLKKTQTNRKNVYLGTL